jgi:Trk-type K+ transport system membrane component
MSAIFGFWTRLVNQEDANLKRLLPAIILVVYSFLGAGIFYAIEKNGTCPLTFWEALFFVQTVYTTIGQSLGRTGRASPPPPSSSMNR